jgi:hypothetical protein
VILLHPAPLGPLTKGTHKCGNNSRGTTQPQGGENKILLELLLPQSFQWVDTRARHDAMPRLRFTALRQRKQNHPRGLTPEAFADGGEPVEPANGRRLSDIQLHKNALPSCNYQSMF